ncbi:hypothetical protein K474DRAFT_1770171, partial [Panus rudis PR-1116 ss-1]
MPSESDADAGFVSKDDDAQTLWEVIEIIEERKGQYRVRWAGKNPKTHKRWAPTWVDKSDCTDELVRIWKAKQANPEPQKRKRPGSRRSLPGGVVDPGPVPQRRTRRSLPSPASPTSVRRSARTRQAQSIGRSQRSSNLDDVGDPAPDSADELDLLYTATAPSAKRRKVSGSESREVSQLTSTRPQPGQNSRPIIDIVKCRTTRPVPVPDSLPETSTLPPNSEPPASSVVSADSNSQPVVQNRQKKKPIRNSQSSTVKPRTFPRRGDGLAHPRSSCDASDSEERRNPRNVQSTQSTSNVLPSSSVGEDGDEVLQSQEGAVDTSSPARHTLSRNLRHRPKRSTNRTPPHGVSEASQNVVSRLRTSGVDVDMTQPTNDESAVKQEAKETTTQDMGPATQNLPENMTVEQELRLENKALQGEVELLRKKIQLLKVTINALEEELAVAGSL